MAKKKEEKVESKSKSVDGLALLHNIVKKEYGEGILSSGLSIVDAPRTIINVSPRIDALLNEGMVSGTWMNVLGAEKRGKTTLVLRMAKVAQDAGYYVIYNNVEHRLKEINLKGCRGLIWNDENKFLLVQSTKDKVLSGPDFLNITEHALKNLDKVFVIFDSISSLAHPKLQEEGAGAQTRGSMGKYVSDFCNNMAPIVRMKGHIVVNIQQFYNNVTGYGKTKFAGGGSKISYQGDCILEAKQRTELKSGDKIIGQSVEWECSCSELGTIPGTSIESFIRYGTGIDVNMELVEMAKEVGIIDVAGAWLTYGDVKLQGADKFSQHLDQNPKLYDEIYARVKESYKALREDV